jgi:hypothetical protein
VLVGGTALLRPISARSQQTLRGAFRGEGLDLTALPLFFRPPLRYLGASMGNEQTCTLRLGDKGFSGKALLESCEILFRGATRLKIPFNSVTAVQAKDGELHVRTKDDLAVFELGPKVAAQWHQKITNPKSVLEKLGVKPGQAVSLIGSFTADFLADLKKHGAQGTTDKPSKDCPWIFFAPNENQELRRLPSIAKQIKGATALWIVYPKGQKSITESAVRSAGLATGLVDVKVVSCSPVLTALKFVPRKSARST